MRSTNDEQGALVSDDDAETQEARAAVIAEHVASLRDIPLAEWCGNDEGDATRAALIALAEAGAEVYGYLSASGRHWNVWVIDERVTPHDLVIRAGPSFPQSGGQSAQDSAWLRRIGKRNVREGLLEERQEERADERQEGSER